MLSTSLFLLIGAAATVAILHSVLPDHWVPIAIVARTQRWSMMRVVRVVTVAASGHVIASLILGGILALIGLQFQRELDTQQGHIIGGILILTGVVFLISCLVGGGHGHHHDGGGHTHSHRFEHGHDHSHKDHDHSHEHKPARETSLSGRLASIAVPFGVAASPDLTILPVALAASASGAVAIVSVLGVFAVMTLATFVGLTVLATLAGYQIKGAWIEKNANTITSFVLIALGIVAYVGF